MSDYRDLDTTAQAPAVVINPNPRAAIRPKKKHTVRNLILAFLLIVLCFGAVLGTSLYLSYGHIQQHMNSIKTAYSACEDAANKGDFQAMLPHIHTAADKITAINNEMSGWQWTVATYIPHYGTDVKIARDGVDIANDLVTQVYMPILTKFEQVSATDFGSVSDLGSALSMLGEDAQSLMRIVDNATNVLANCKARTNALPTSHIDKVNEFIDILKTGEDITDELFVLIKPVADFLGGIGGYLTANTASFAEAA